MSKKERAGDKKGWTGLLKEHKTLLIIVIIGFFLIEVEIFALAAMKSGRQSWTQVMDDSGSVIYEVKGSTLTNFNKYYFEDTFGNLDAFQVKLETREVPFPFRAWFSAAIGLPVGLVLLLGFVLKAVMVFVQGDSAGAREAEHDQGKGGNLAESLLLRISRFNIFIIGFLIFSAVFLYWVLPNLLSFLAKAGIETIINFKWVFIAGFSALFFLFSWFMYMKYQLAKKSLDVQTEIKKYEVQLEYIRQTGARLPALEHLDGTPEQLIEYSPDNDRSLEFEKDES